MKKQYYDQMIEILLQKPKGLRLSAIATNIYNMNAGLFSSPELYDDIYRVVKQFLYRESKKKKSVIVHVPDKWGYYAIRKGMTRQLKIQFDKTNQQ